MLYGGGTSVAGGCWPTSSRCPDEALKAPFNRSGGHDVVGQRVSEDTLSAMRRPIRVPSRATTRRPCRCATQRPASSGCWRSKRSSSGTGAEVQLLYGAIDPAHWTSPRAGHPSGCGPRTHPALVAHLQGPVGARARHYCIGSGGVGEAQRSAGSPM